MTRFMIKTKEYIREKYFWYVMYAFHMVIGHMTVLM